MQSLSFLIFFLVWKKFNLIKYGFCIKFNNCYIFLINSIVQCDSLTVLSNQGSNKIQGIMLCPSGAPTKVQFNDQFLKMKNLRLLKICNIQSCGCLEYLPNGLRLLDWAQFPWSSLPSKFYPKNLVSLNLSHSRIEKPLKQVRSLVFINYYFLKLQFKLIIIIIIILFYFLSSTDLFIPNLDKIKFQLL